MDEVPIDGDDADRELVARLRAADPARAVPASSADDARPDWIDELTEATMSTDPSHSTSRGRLAWLVAAAAVVLIAALGFAFVGGDDDTDPVAGGGESSATPQPSDEPSQPDEQPSQQSTDGPTDGPSQEPSEQPSGSPSSGTPGETLVVTVADTSARCIPPTAETADKLASVAFEATATKVSGKRATLQVTQWFRTDPGARYGDEVMLRSSDASLVQQVGGISFQEGSSYLIAVNDNRQMLLCGHSGEADGSLEQLYARAFSGN